MLVRLVIVSDSHRDDEVLEKIYQKEQAKTSMFLHCGDSCSTPFNIKPFISVRGNCDYLYPFPDKLVFNLPIGKIYICHGTSGRSDIRKAIKEEQPDIILCGHTHIHSHELIDGCHVFNPGSVSNPRDGSNGTYLIIEGTSKENIKWEFVNII